LIEQLPDDEIDTWIEVFSERERNGKVLARRLEILKNKIINLDGKKYDTSEGKKLKKYVNNTIKMQKEFIEKTKIVDDFIIDRIIKEDLDTNGDLDFRKM